MEIKAPNPVRIHPMAPRDYWVAPCGAVLPNALVAWAHWVTHQLCPLWAAVKSAKKENNS